MLIKEYAKSFVRPPNPNAQHLRCFAALDVDVTEVLPYLNTVLKAYDYSADPPTLTLKLPGKLVTIHPREIAINIVTDENKAEFWPGLNRPSTIPGSGGEKSNRALRWPGPGSLISSSCCPRAIAASAARPPAWSLRWSWVKARRCRSSVRP